MADVPDPATKNMRRLVKLRRACTTILLLWSLSFAYQPWGRSWAEGGALLLLSFVVIGLGIYTGLWRER